MSKNKKIELKERNKANRDQSTKLDLADRNEHFYFYFSFQHVSASLLQSIVTLLRNIYWLIFDVDDCAHHVKPVYNVIYTSIVLSSLQIHSMVY